MNSSSHPFFIFLLIFLFSPTLSSSSPAYVYAHTPTIKKAYEEVLSLKKDPFFLKKAKKSTPNNAFLLLVENYQDVLQLLITEDENLYQDLKDHQSKRIKKIRTNNQKHPWTRLLEAEVRFQWALVKLKFNDELSAAWELKQVYQLLLDNKKEYPDFIHHKKLLGLFEIFIGSVPEKYEWLTKLFGYSGQVSKGIQYLTEVEASNSIFALEASMLKAAAQKYVLRLSDCISCNLEKQIAVNKENYLFAYLYSSVLLKEGKADKAYFNLSEFETRKEFYAFPIAELLKGEILLYKGKYSQSRNYLYRFLRFTKGKNHVKDAFYKIFLTYWLEGDDDKAVYYLQKVQTVGQAVYDSDKYAEKFARTDALPDKVLMKSRLSCDGGYLDEALGELRKYCIKRDPEHKDNIEFWYRKGRVFQLQGMNGEARENYLKVVKTSNDKNYYFAPNACLQLGYMFREEGDLESAREYFNKALLYQDHEYKNSIDNKAKAALGELK